jgi:uncharacterized membrane protein YgaE (UPF0421/DUF939 family)
MMALLSLDARYQQSRFYLVMLIAIFGILTLLIFIIRKIMLSRNHEDKPNDNDIAEENVNRYVQDIDDEKTKKEFEEYSKNTVKEDKKDKKEGKDGEKKS